MNSEIKAVLNWVDGQPDRFVVVMEAIKEALEKSGHVTDGEVGPWFDAASFLEEAIEALRE